MCVILQEYEKKANTYLFGCPFWFLVTNRILMYLLREA